MSFSLPHSLRLSVLRERASALPEVLPRGLGLAACSVWLLAGGFGVALKAWRVWLHPQHLSLPKKLGLLVPELAFAVAMACSALVLALALRRTPRLALWISQGLGITCTILCVLSHGYFLASGQPLDYAMFAFSLSRASERLGVVQSEAHAPLVIGSVFTLLAVAALPGWIWRRAQRRAAREGSEAGPTGVASQRFHRGSMLALGALAAGVFALTGYSPARRIERGFARDSVTMLALGFVRARLPDTRYRGTPSRPRKTGPASLRPRDNAELRNIVLIMLESTRADATSVYAPALRTTPFLERFARESVVVERAYTVVPHTTKALVAILCGFEPEVTLSTIESHPGGLPGRCLPSLLAAQGYETAFFQAPTGKFEDRKMLAENLGFATFISGDEAPRDGLERINYFGYEDAIMLRPSEAWLRARGSRPFLTAYLTSASHHPYGVPKHHKLQRFADQRARNKYLNAVNYGDRVVEQIVDQYRKLSLLDDTIFVVVGDHGEAFGEHGLYFHDDVLFEEALRVPLLFRLPGAERAGARIPGPVSELSIAPSVIALAGFEPPDRDYEQGSVFEHPSQPALYAHCYRSDRCAAVLRYPHKLIDHFDERPAELYDLSRDPSELNDISDDHPDLVEKWSREVMDLRSAIHATYRDAASRALRKYLSKTPPKSARPLRAEFGDYLRIVGLRAPTESALANFGKPGFQRFVMAYYIYVKRRVPPGFELRLQMRGSGGSVTDTHLPLRGLLALEDFPVGQYVEDSHRVSLPDNWRSPTLTLCLSLVDAAGIPVPITKEDGATVACLPTLTVPVKN